MKKHALVDMEKHFLRVIILNGLAPLAGERTIQALYYILRGRKANQTLQDIHLFRLHPYYRLFPGLSREDWEENVYFLHEDGCIEVTRAAGPSPKPSFRLTERGKEEQTHGCKQYQLERWLSPVSFSIHPERFSLFWQRLHLIVQTVSQLLAGDIGFQPVVQNRQVQQWVKRVLASRDQRLLWQEGLHDELLLLMNRLPQSVQEIVVRQFSGAAQAGLTETQMAREREQAPSYIHVQFRFALATMIFLLEEEAPRFPLLSQLIDAGSHKDLRLSESARQTYALVQQRYTIEQIAAKRNIKPSTVEDHLVEIALHCPEWDAGEYVSETERQQVAELSQQLGTSRLRLLKDALGPAYSYLKIRLALALHKGREAK